MGKQIAKQSGFASSAETDCTVSSGQTVSETADLGRPYAFISIYCADMVGVPSATTMTLQVANSADGTLNDLYSANMGALLTSETLPDGSGDTYHTTVIDAIGIQKIQITLSGAATADVDFKIVGVDAGKLY